jgi:hypothetical protein
MASLAMPYPLLGWAQQLDLSALPDDVALSARQYLTRMHEMRPDVAARMGHELATEVMRYVALPPAGTPPWAYLAAITAERLRSRISKLKRLEGQSVSVGIACYEGDTSRAPVSFGGLMRDATGALRRAREAGGDRIEFAAEAAKRARIQIG